MHTLLHGATKFTLHSKKPNYQIYFRLHGTAAFSCGVPIFVWVLINAMWLLQSKWVPIFMGCLFCVGAYYPNFMVDEANTAAYAFIQVELAAQVYCHLCSCTSKKKKNCYDMGNCHRHVLLMCKHMHV